MMNLYSPEEFDAYLERHGIRDEQTITKLKHAYALQLAERVEASLTECITLLKRSRDKLQTRH